MRSALVASVLNVMLMSGCAWTEQHVNLKPTVTIGGGNVGQGGQVGIEVEDERPSNSLGTKMPAGGGQITPVQEPADVVRAALVDGLGRLGFKPLGERSKVPVTLKAELRAIDYKIAQGFWAGGLTVDVAIKGICVIEAQQRYEKLYRGHHEESVQVAQSQGENEEYINDALSQAINQILSDRDLLLCLATHTTP